MLEKKKGRKQRVQENGGSLQRDVERKGKGSDSYRETQKSMKVVNNLRHILFLQSSRADLNRLE
jgi:hypothetical protein